MLIGVVGDHNPWDAASVPADQPQQTLIEERPPGSRAAALYGSDEVVEDFYCNYGLNPDYRPAFERAGLRVSGVGGDGEVRIVELPRHPFFLATLFCFQTRSTDRTHPLVAGFVKVVHARAP